jgi:phospholipase C
MLNRLEAAAAQRRLARRGVDTEARLRPAAEIGTDSLPQIEHIVILMMENHSYDNYLGMLGGRGDGFRDRSHQRRHERAGMAQDAVDLAV